jgi:hypothetical protein
VHEIKMVGDYLGRHVINGLTVVEAPGFAA